MPISECPYVSDSDSILYDPLPSKASGNAVMTVLGFTLPPEARSTVTT